MTKRIRNFTTWVFLVSVLPVHGAVPADFAFGGPEVLKLDWSTRSLSFSDLNEDGLEDIAVINNDRAQIELFFQRGPDEAAGPGGRKVGRNRWEPVLEDARFLGDSITIGFPMFDLAVGDYNGDGRADLAYTARETPLSIRLQGEDGRWSSLREYDDLEALGWIGSLRPADLEGDGVDELVALSADAVRVFRSKDGELPEEPETYFLTGENPFNLMVVDVDGDGRCEVLYLSSAGEQALVLRESDASGRFGPERRFVFDRPVREVRLLEAGADATFCAVDSRAGTLQFFSLRRGDVGEDAEAMKWWEGHPEVYPLFERQKKTPPIAKGDLSGDGRADVAVANPGSPEIILLAGGENGFLPAETFPSFAGVSSLAMGRFFTGEENQLAVLSEEEAMLGFSVLSEGGRISFPRRIGIGELEPLACTAIDVDADGYDELAVVGRTKAGVEARLLRPSSRDNLDGGWDTLASLNLEDMRRNPFAVKGVDMFGEAGSGLMLFVAREAPVFLAVSSEPDFAIVEVAADSTVRESLLKDVSPAQVSVFDLDGDGTLEMIVGREGYARALRAEGDELIMVDQFNARRSEDKIEAVVPVFAEGGDLEGLVFYVSETGELQFLQRGEDGVFRFRRAGEVGKVDLSGWMRLPGEDENRVVLATSDSLLVFGGAADGWRSDSFEDFETDLEDVNFTHVARARFGGDARPSLLAVDGKDHIVEVLTRESEGESWRSRYYWEIFVQDMHYQGRTGANLEPREIHVADFTGDGQDDFAFLIHDRILFYPQE